MLGAALLARTAKRTGNEEYVRVARSAMEYSRSRQLQDGSWWYGEEDKYHWIDNFHTGYNLDSLYFYLESVGGKDFYPNLDKGLKFYKRISSRRPDARSTTTLEPIPWIYSARPSPSTHWYSCRSGDATALDLAEEVAAWTIRNMQDSEGYFYYRQYPLMKAKTPMLHWGQATMFKALAHLFHSLSCSAQ